MTHLHLIFGKRVPSKFISGLLTTCFAITLLQLSGCQLLLQPQQMTTHNTSYYGGYYMWIKSLAEEELKAEVRLQQENSKLGSELAETHLLLLYSLPNSPIHNPYTAKSKLNQKQVQIDQAELNTTDLAFIVMLKDQLNQQLLILNKLILNEKASTETQKKLELQQHSIELLEAKSHKLQQQIQQLKNIEKNINNHG
ncbi:hypothetical protein [Thalassotalea atypica]|uniref:hypothetical protein n=1 Tax=Thalassotalea atypica TaxID=2054316 RepID=UPI002573EEA3|nr:hypothetical protein [Thalassotalea atypica]